jgi:hypothetical protein
VELIWLLFATNLCSYSRNYHQYQFGSRPAVSFGWRVSDTADL